MREYLRGAMDFVTGREPIRLDSGAEQELKRLEALKAAQEVDKKNLDMITEAMRAGNFGGINHDTNQVALEQAIQKRGDKIVAASEVLLPKLEVHRDNLAKAGRNTSSIDATITDVQSNLR